MEKLISYELTKTLILVGMVMAGTSALLVKLVLLITKLQGSFKPYQKATLNYLFTALLFFSAVGGLAYWSYLKNQQHFFFIYQACFLLLGIVHVYWMPKYLKWSGNSNAFWSELLFTLIMGLIGSIGFLIVHRFFNPAGLAAYRFFSLDGLPFYMAGSIGFFIIPWFVNQTFLSAVAIPPRILKQWYYPVDQEIEEPDEGKLKHLLVISFEFPKQHSDRHKTNFRAKAPVDMEMGELFYYFINDYNERHPHDQIDFLLEDGSACGWVFSKKSPFFSINPKFFDADKTIFNNGIKENDVIICSRSLN